MSSASDKLKDLVKEKQAEELKARKTEQAVKKIQAQSGQ